MDYYVVGIEPIYKSGTNSTMFTECCQVAICDDEQKCPACGKKVIGWDQPQAQRSKTRWKNATRFWNRSVA